MDPTDIKIPDNFFSFLTELLKVAGIDKFLVVATIVGLVILGLKIFFYILKKKHEEENKGSIGEISVGQEAIVKTLRNLVNIINYINMKIKYVMSYDDARKLIEMATMNKLFCNCLEKFTLIRLRIKRDKNSLEDCKKEFHTSMKNVWGNYIKHLNLYRAPIRLGDVVECYFYKEFCLGEEGSLLRNVMIEIFEKDSDAEVLHDRIKDIFYNFYLKVDEKVQEELEKVRDILEAGEE